MAVYGHECQVSAAHVTALVRQVMLDRDLYADLERGAEDPVDRGLQYHEITNAAGHEKIQMIDGGGNDVAA